MNESIPIKNGKINREPNLSLRHPACMMLAPILKEVAREFQLNPADLFLLTREEYIAYPRQVAMFLGCEHTACSPKVIGQFWGRKCWTVTHAIERVKCRIETERGQREKVERIKTRLGL